MTAAAPAADPAARFDTLDELQAAHRALLAELSDLDRPDALDRVTAFLGRAAATGVVLDAPDDRRQAQAVIDYWTAALLAGCQQTGRRRPGVTVLAPFPESTVRETAAAAGRWLDELPAADRELVLRVLLRLVALPEVGTEFGLVTVPRADLALLGPPEAVDRLLGELIRLGVVRPAGAGGSAVRLATAALTREWPALRDLLDRRRKFRGVARFWAQNRRPADLIGRDSIEEADAYYRDQNDEEKEFLRASRQDVQRRNRNWAWLLWGAIVGLLLLLTAAAVAIVKYRQALAAERDASMRRGQALRTQREWDQLRRELRDRDRLLLDPRGLTAEQRVTLAAEVRDIDAWDRLLTELRSPGPVRPGVSIGPKTGLGAGGSVGCVLRRKSDGARYLLTVDYVAGGAERGATVVHPARVEKEYHGWEPAPIGTVERTLGEGNRFALVKLNPDVPASNAVPGVGPIAGVEAELKGGLRVVLIGSGSGKKDTDLLGPRPDGGGWVCKRISVPSDAGAPVLTADGNRLVGLLYKSEIDVNRPPNEDTSWFLPVAPVLDQLRRDGYELLGQDTPE